MSSPPTPVISSASAINNTFSTSPSSTNGFGGLTTGSLASSSSNNLGGTSSNVNSNNSNNYNNYNNNNNNNTATSANMDQVLGATTHVSFVCQQCSQPLKLDPSLADMDAETSTKMAMVLQSNVVAALSNTINDDNSARPQHQQVAALSSASSSSSLAFGSVPNSPGPLTTSGGLFAGGGSSSPKKNNSLSYRIRAASKLFDLMSNAGETDYPLCKECNDQLQETLDLDLIDAEQERDYYQQFLNNIKDEEIDELHIKQLQQELERIEKESSDLYKKVSNLEIEREEVRKQTELLKLEEERIDKENELYWKEYNEFQRSLQEFFDERDSVEMRLQYASTTLEKLKKTNVRNDAFHIWHEGHFGTINNFRLGRLPNIPVEYNEINAAWGQTALLLQSMADRLNLKFERYQLVPLGSYSRIDRLSDKAQLELYSYGGFKTLWNNKFIHAMTAFLDCLQQLTQHIENQDRNFKIPYVINKDKIGGISIKSSDESWTKALKYTLTNLKWCLAWVCKMNNL